MSSIVYVRYSVIPHPHSMTSSHSNNTTNNVIKMSAINRLQYSSLGNHYYKRLSTSVQCPVKEDNILEHLTVTGTTSTASHPSTLARLFEEKETQ